MKRKYILFALGASLVLCSCSQGTAAPEINAAVDSDARVQLDDMDIECHITYVNEGMASLTISSPDNLRELKFSRADGKNSMSLGTLICRSEKSVPGSGSLSQQVFSMLDAVRSSDMKLAEEKDGIFTFTGDSDGKTITIETDSSGKPIKLENGELAVCFV